MFDPESGYPMVVPYVRYADPEAATRWLRDVLAASEAVRLTLPDGSVGHAELRVGRHAVIAVGGTADRAPGPPASRRGVRAMTLVFVDDVDGAARRAVELGGTLVDEPSERPWGLRQAVVADPEGHVWELGTHVADVAAEQWGARVTGAWFTSGSGRRTRPSSGPDGPGRGSGGGR